MQISDIDKKIEALQKLKSILQKQPDNMIELIFQLYIRVKKTAVAAEYLNISGYRLPGTNGERKYISTDITAILENENNKELVDPEIYELALKMKNSRKLLDKFLLELGGGDDA